MRNLCIIPARGGSKRIPRKNVKEFLGKPIIAYSIEVAIKSGLFAEVMVSTDDDEIKQIAERYGAKVPFLRSEQTANDFATLADVVDEVKVVYEKDKKQFDTICLLLPTAPFVTTPYLISAFELLSKNDVDSVRPVVRFSYPIQRSFRMNSEGRVEMFYPEFQQTRSQDLETAYHDAGLFYFMKWTKGLKGIKRYAFEIPEYTCQDIDTMEDWKLAEVKYNAILG